MRDCRGDYLDPEQRVGDDVFLAGHMADALRELRNAVQVVEMSW